MVNRSVIDRSGRLLERALIFSFFIHAAAMGSMAILLLSGMPGGGTADDQARIRHIAGHPWLWRLGWIPWQFTALSDVLIAVGLLRAAWIPKLPALLTALVTVAAVIPDQAGQVAWMMHGIELAQSGDAAAYLQFEARIFRWIAVWGGTLYTLAAVGWTACLVAGRTWNRPLTILSVVLWPLFAWVNAGPLLPAAMRPSAAAVAAGNAIGFILLELWLALAAEAVLRRSRPGTLHGRDAPWRHPGLIAGPIIDLVANSRFIRAIAERAPMISFVSDVTDVIYVNYVVEAERLEPLVPAGLELQRVGPGGRFSVFTFLTFRHGHFGPRLLGPLRNLLPSPIHSNWRIHVRDPRTDRRGVTFLSNSIDSTPHALAGRLLSEGMAMHVPAAAELRREGGNILLALDPGSGSAPDARAELRPAGRTPESGPWSAAFATWGEMLEYVVPQDRALSVQPWHGHVTRQEIRLEIPLEACEPLEGRVTSRLAAAIAGDAEPFCFRVPRLELSFDSEVHDPME